MKKYLLITLGFLLCHIVSYCQNTDTVQPDSIYRKNKVHLRSSYYEGSPSKSREIFVFNRSGFYSEFILTDNATGKISSIMLAYTYSKAGILTAENDTIFRDSKRSVEKATLYYGPGGYLAKKVLKNNGRITSEITYSPGEKMENEKLYRNDDVYREQTSYYDEHHKKNRFAGTEIGDKNAKPRVLDFNGKKYTIPANTEDQTWDYLFENTYDSAGNLISQRRRADDKVQDEKIFIYDDRGLLVEEKDVTHGQVTNFEYTYY